MKKYKKLLSIVLSLCILAGFATTAGAIDNNKNQEMERGSDEYFLNDIERQLEWEKQT